MTIYKAQFGEDKLLAELFADNAHGFYVEVGAYDGCEASNSFYFEQIGWNGLLIEANPTLCEKCKMVRPRALTLNYAVVAPDSPTTVDFQISTDLPMLSSLSVDTERLRIHTAQVSLRTVTVPAKTLNCILSECNVSEIDFVTIDVEGYEWDVLKGFDLKKWKPQVIILERNATTPDLRILRYMHENSYSYSRTTGVNDWFVYCPTRSIWHISSNILLYAKFYCRQLAKKCVRSIRQHSNALILIH